jgi:hypothetical protein
MHLLVVCTASAASAFVCASAAAAAMAFASAASAFVDASAAAMALASPHQLWYLHQRPHFPPPCQSQILYIIKQRLNTWILIILQLVSYNVL